jgi:hypothetical protein
MVAAMAMIRPTIGTTVARPGCRTGPLRSAA